MKDNVIISLAEALMIVEELEDEDENFIAADVAVKGVLCKEASEYLIERGCLFAYKKSIGMTCISKESA